MYRDIILKLLLVILVPLPFRDVRADVPASGGEGDSIIVSLMTCYPGDAIWELYGHTALRIRLKSGVDVAFNYGMFDFSTPNFVGRFLLGRTDYKLAAYPTSEFLDEYSRRGSKVVEQYLNLNIREKTELFRSLCENAREENCTYRYNFLYDNCTIEAVNKVESAVTGRMQFPADTVEESYRDIIHRYTGHSPWSEFGQDLLLGAEADKPVTVKQKMFAPLYLMKFASRTKIIASDGSVRPLVYKTSVYLPEAKLRISAGFFVPPVAMAVIILVAVAALCFLEIRSGKSYLWLDVLLMGTEGLAGILIFVLFFFSEHPTVSSNFLLWVLNPLPLLFIISRIISWRRGTSDKMLYVYFAMLLSFLLAFAFLPQRFGAAIICFVVALLMQTSADLILQSKKRWRRSS